MILAGARSKEIGEYLKTRNTVLIPMGSIEQHGDAAPLGCDTIIPVRLCATVGMQTGVPYTPAITFGSSNHHMGFAGTISLRTTTLSNIIEDISVSLYAHGFRRMLFINGHGGNRGPALCGIKEAVLCCKDADIRYLPYWELPGAGVKEHSLFGDSNGAHVTVSEVSLVWHLLGNELPNFDRIQYPPPPDSGKNLSAQQWKEQYPDGGAGGDLSQVSLQKGEEYFEYLVNALSELIRDMEKNED